MPIVSSPKYELPFYLRNGHINTLYTYLKRRNPSIVSHRTRHTTIDGDFVDVDYITKANSKVVLLLHGLEGSSQSQYIQGTAYHLSQNGYDVAMLNHRSCSGEINKTLTMYHSGFTIDVHTMVEILSQEYEELFIVGFSMGGNMALKYLGDNIYDLSKHLKSVVAVSVPCDLASSSYKLTHWSNYLYERNFLGTLVKKAKLKQEQFPDLISLKDIKKIDSLVGFDDHFTGPIHGFKDAADYYANANSLQFLKNIRRPALLINALDDPFLTPSCQPYDIADQTDLLHFMPIAHGGHVGFYQPRSSQLFIDDLVLDFLSKQ